MSIENNFLIAAKRIESLRGESRYKIETLIRKAYDRWTNLHPKYVQRQMIELTNQINQIADDAAASH